MPAGMPGARYAKVDNISPTSRRRSLLPERLLAFGSYSVSGGEAQPAHSGAVYLNGGQFGAGKVTMAKLTWLRLCAPRVLPARDLIVLKESLQQTDDFVCRSRHGSIQCADPFPGPGIGAAQLEY